MVRHALLFLGAAATGCSFQAHSAQQPSRVDGGVDGAPALHDAAHTIDAPPDAKVYLDALPVTGSLVVSSAAIPNGDTNLTTEGTLDWAHWAHQSAADFDHKLGANMISDVTVTSGGTKYQIGNVTATASWLDGTPHQAVTATGTGVGTVQGSALQLTAPAGIAPHTLRVYVGNKSSTARLDVSLSDSSASAFTTSQTAGSTSLHTLYTITYNAASANQTLTVTWTDTADSTGGFEMVMSATLQ